jgi:hypothetical protein
MTSSTLASETEFMFGQKRSLGGERARDLRCMVCSILATKEHWFPIQEVEIRGRSGLTRLSVTYQVRGQTPLLAGRCSLASLSGWVNGELSERSLA